MKRVFICSPYRGNVEHNRFFAQMVCRVAVGKGYAPYAPHLYLPLFLDDSSDHERTAGMDVGRKYLEVCHELWAVGTPSQGMLSEIDLAKYLGLPVRMFANLQELMNYNEVSNGEGCAAGRSRGQETEVGV